MVTDAQLEERITLHRRAERYIHRWTMKLDKDAVIRMANRAHRGHNYRGCSKGQVQRYLTEWVVGTVRTEPPMDEMVKRLNRIRNECVTELKDEAEKLDRKAEDLRDRADRASMARIDLENE